MNTEANIGHGHVWPRPDKFKAKCGGPTICPPCIAEAAGYADIGGVPLRPTLAMAELRGEYLIVAARLKYDLPDCSERTLALKALDDSFRRAMQAMNIHHGHINPTSFVATATTIAPPAAPPTA